MFPPEVKEIIECSNKVAATTSPGKEIFGLTKKDFNSRLAKVIESHRVGSKLIGKPKEFIIAACQSTARFSKVANEPEVEVRLKNWPCGPRKVKMVVLKRPDGFEQPVPKNQLVDQLYPPKTTVRTPNLERKHITTVRAAMRQIVDYQLRNYRKTLEYPVECAVTGKVLRLGMKVDIDHLHKPFVQIADEWVKSLGLTYCDLILCGPPNLKRFKHHPLIEDWQIWHEENANFIAVCAAANRSKGSGDYATPSEIIGSFKKGGPEDIDLEF